MRRRRGVRAVLISAFAVTGVLGGAAPALAATQDFVGHTVDFGAEASLQRALDQADAMASAAGYDPATQCVITGHFAMQISSNDAWEAWVSIRCTN